MLRLVLAGALAALAAGCATPPPMPRELSDAVDGARVTLVRGQDLYINLDGNQTTGFRWSLSRGGEPVMTQVGEATYAPRAAEGRLTGSGGVTTFHFRAAAVGSTSLAFGYRRPWEANIPPAKTVRFDVKVE
jgi:inhibitor of cysteine peptidase